MDFSVDERLARAATLPAPLYTDPAVLAVEKARVFGASWQLVGRADQVARPGAFFTARVADEEVLVVRGGDEKLRALSNVCRHRAGPVASGAGSCRALSCGYHGWTYGLDGRLLATPEFEGVENFRREDVRLPEFSAATWMTVAFSDEIQLEDIAICEAVQRGLRSRTYVRGRYSEKRESGVHHFHRLWAAAMELPRLPER